MHRETDDPCVLLRECGLIPSGWQLVVAAGPPSGVSAVLNPRARRRGFFFSRGGRKPQPSPVHHPAGGGVLVAGDGRWRFSRSARAGCVRAGRGFECEVSSNAMASVSFFEVFNHTI